MADIFSNDRLMEKFFHILNNADPRNRLYVYRVLDGKPMKPAVLNGAPFPDLLQHLRDELGGGTFKLLIRRSDQMIFAGTVSIVMNFLRKAQR